MVAKSGVYSPGHRAGVRLVRTRGAPYFVYNLIRIHRRIELKCPRPLHCLLRFIRPARIAGLRWPFRWRRPASLRRTSVERASTSGRWSADGMRRTYRWSADSHL